MSSKRCFSGWRVQSVVNICKGRRHQNVRKQCCFEAVCVHLKGVTSVASQGQESEKHRFNFGEHRLKPLGCVHPCFRKVWWLVGPEQRKEEGEEGVDWTQRTLFGASSSGGVSSDPRATCQDDRPRSEDLVLRYSELSAVPKHGRSQRGRTQKHGNAHERAQMNAKRAQKRAKERKRAQESANERFRVKIASNQVQDSVNRGFQTVVRDS